MKPEFLRSKIQKALQGELPGDLAHDEMSPPQRLKNKRPPSTGFIEAAVAVVIGLQENQWYFTVIRRPTYDGAHSGQIAFPGGKRDATDAHLIETASRECFEEIGLLLQEAQYVGKLSPVYIPVSGFFLHPFVYVIDEFPAFIPDEREVDAIHLLAIDILMKDEIKGAMRIEHQGTNTFFHAPCFHFGDIQIWGATAIVLNELRWVLSDSDID
jgi:8-oxo-dGTP pyrophosphatase MutT (NUDIX family)